jgi:hypothetical protein
MFKEDGERVATLAGAKADADARDPSRRMAELNFIFSTAYQLMVFCDHKKGPQKTRKKEKTQQKVTGAVSRQGVSCVVWYYTSKTAMTYEFPCFSPHA